MSSQISLRKIFQILAISIGLFAAVVALFLWWAVGTTLPKESEIPVEHHAEFPDAPEKTQIKIATYNIGFGQGVKSSPMDWRDEPYTRQKLSELVNVVQRLDADILLLQEVDINSNRSHHINEADLLIRAGHYAYSACAIVWNKNYVPFPFWPPKFHIGDIKTANCILSKYPMSKHERIIFDKPASNPFWYNWGYLDRGAHKLEVKIGSRSLFVVNMHLEAYEEEARENQAKFIPTWVKDIKGPIVIGGDFNAIPSDASKRDNFLDEPATTYLDDHTIDYLKEGLKDYTEALPTSLCSVKEHLCLTFPADEPTRRLDYLFGTRGAKFVDGRVVNEARDASDHLPVVGLLELVPGQ